MADAQTQKSTNVRKVRFIGGLLRGLELASPELATQAAWKLWTTPQRFRPPEREAKLLARAEQLQVTFAGGALQAWAWGQGPVVLLMHGWEGRGAQLGSFVRPLVEAGRRVVAFDGPAHGRSPGNVAHVPAFADAIGAVARSQGHLEAIVAHSMGAAAAGWMLAPLRVPKAVLIAPPDPREVLIRFQELLGFRDGTRERLLERSARTFGRSLAEFGPELLLGDASTELMLIHDQGDRFVPLSDGQRWLQARPEARWVQTEGLGHHRILRDPQVVARTVAFLTESFLTESPDLESTC